MATIARGLEVGTPAHNRATYIDPGAHNMLLQSTLYKCYTYKC